MTSAVEIAQQQEDRIKHLEGLLVESLEKMDGLMDKGWRPLFGVNWDDEEGPSLEQIKQVAARNEEMAALNPHVKNGLILRTAYVLDGGIHYAGVPGSRQGRGVNVQDRIDNPINQDNFFGQSARERREAALYNTGHALFIGNDDDFEVRGLPISRISDDYRNPEQSDEIWAYRVDTVKYVTGADGRVTREYTHEWIFRNTYWEKGVNKRTGQRQKTFRYEGKPEPISQTKRIFGKPVNGNTGWAYGIPDVLAAISWAEEYRQAMLDGKRMNASMASIWATMKQNTQAGAASGAVTVGNMTGAGGLAHVGQGNAMQAMTTAGQAYDFARLLPLLANFAAGIGVSVIALSANPGNAGGSYGAAKSLDRPEQLTTTARRQYHIDLDREVLLWMGAPADKLDVWFNPIIDPTERYREDQRIGLRTATGLFEGDELKLEYAAADGKAHATPVPDGWLIPNNRESIELRTIDPNTNGPGSGAAPTQGSGSQFNKTGSGDQKSDDIRGNRESLMEMLNHIKADELMEKMNEFLAAVDRMQGES